MLTGSLQRHCEHIPLEDCKPSEKNENEITKKRGNKRPALSQVAMSVCRRKRKASTTQQNNNFWCLISFYNLSLFSLLLLSFLQLHVLLLLLPLNTTASICLNNKRERWIGKWNRTGKLIRPKQVPLLLSQLFSFSFDETLLFFSYPPPLPVLLLDCYHPRDSTCLHNCVHAYPRVRGLLNSV